MYKKIFLSAFVAASMICGASFSVVYAEDTGIDKEQVEETDKGRKFDDRERLTETLVDWQYEILVTSAKQNLKEATYAYKNRPEVTTPEYLAELEANLEAARLDYKDALVTYKKEKRRLTVMVKKLTDDQVFALNRSLNNATHNGLLVDLNSRHMRDVLKGDYNKQQINSLTKALEEEAKFDKLADKFISKYDVTGNEKFLYKADMMSDKGLRQQQKFMAKIDKFDHDNSDEVEHHGKIKKSARNSAKKSARDVSKKSAKGNAKDKAKSNAKNIAKSNAKDVAKSNAKAVAKSNAKAVAKSNAKAVAKSNAKAVAKSNAKAVAKSKAKDNARNKAKSNNRKKA